MKKKIRGLKSKLVIVDDIQEQEQVSLPVEQGKIGQSFEEFLKEYPIQTERKENESNS